MFKNLIDAPSRASSPSRRSIVAALTLGAVASVVPPAFTADSVRRRAAGDAVLDVAFVYVSPVGDSGWSYQHDLGRRDLERALGASVRTRFVESVSEGADSERVMRELASQGARLVVATSFGYLLPALKVAAEFPHVTFVHAGGYRTAPNFGTYNARYYEARYLAGYLAGRNSRSGVAGYVAGFPVPEVVQGINAFTLGMRAANPLAQVKVVWLNAWFDPAREREAATTLVNQGADILTNHSGSSAVAQLAEEKGVKLLAYQSDMSRVAPRAQLAAVVHHWGPYYTTLARSVIDGSWTPRPVWGGMKDGFVSLAALSASIPGDVVADIERRRESIVSGRFAPFSGVLEDSDGKVRHSGGVLSDADLARMDWFVRGVVGSVPRATPGP